MVFWANVINERTHNNRLANNLSKIFIKKNQELIINKLIINSRNTNLARGPFKQVKSADMAKIIHHKSQIRALKPISKCIKRLRWNIYKYMINFLLKT